MAKRGIDISAHQGNIDLGALRSQIDFVIIRVGYGTKGTIDTKFTRNADLCRSLGIPVGFYWYSYALDVEGAKKEAQAMINAIAPYKDIVKFGVWFDMEDADGYKKKNGMPSNKTLREMCAAFCEATENAGYYSGIYASESWFNNQLKGSEVTPYDKWVAQWPTSGGKQTALNTSADKRSDVHLWQFTSQGRFSGYSGNLDTNYAYLDSFPNPDGSTDTSTPAPEPTPAPTQKFNIGDRVVINGSLYTSSNAKLPAGSVSNKTTNITRYAPGAAHPYNTTGDLGWMNESDIRLAGNETSTAIVKGCKVKFTGTKSYSGIKLASWTTNSVFDVIEVSGDRVVIGKGTAVTAAVNMKDCVKI